MNEKPRIIKLINTKFVLTITYSTLFDDEVLPTKKKKNQHFILLRRIILNLLEMNGEEL